MSHVDADTYDTLVGECMQSALRVIDLCESLHASVGLARASYTESSTLCAALLALFAQRMRGPGDQLKAACDKGILLLRKILDGIYCKNQDKLAVEALAAAVFRVHREAGANGLTYTQFKNWAGQLGGPHKEQNLANQHENYGEDTIQSLPQPSSFDLFGIPSFDQSEIDGLSTFPGLDEWLTPFNHYA